MKSLYEILDVAIDASDEEIKRAYKQLALKYHPDKSRTRNAEDRFKQIRRAYEVLADNKKRDLYDRLGTIEQEGSEMMDLSSRLDKSFSVSMEEINVSPKQPPRAASKKRVGPRSEKLYASQQDLTTTRRRRAEQRDESSTTTKQPRKKSKSRTRRKSCDAVDGAASSKVIAKIKPQPTKVDPSHAKHQMEDVEKVSSSALLRVGACVLFGLAVLNLIKNLIYGIMLLVQLAINAAFVAILYFVLTGRVANIWQECQHFVGNFWTISSDLLMKIVQSLLRR